MHMGDALISPSVGAAFWAGSAALLIRSAGRVKKRLEADERLIPLMGVMGAFVFSAQMVNFAIPGTGSSGHISGGMILSILLGPYEAFLVMASVLTVQALFFGDGGLLALGCNIWNLAFYPAFVAYPLLFRPVVGKGWSRGRVWVASLLGTILSLELGAFSIALQVFLSGRSELPFTTFAFLMLSIHLAIALGEGAVTAGFVNYVRKMRPEVLERRPLGGEVRGFLFDALLLTVLLGGFLSLVASTRPDGLEWAIKRIYGSTGLPPTSYVTLLLERLQKAISLFPGYVFPYNGGLDLLGRVAAAIAGILIVAALLLSIGLLFRSRRDVK